MLLVSLSKSNTGAKLISIPDAINSADINQPTSLQKSKLSFCIQKSPKDCIEGILVKPS